MKVQRVTWEDASLGSLEILEDTYTRTDEYCVKCGRQGTWAGGGPVDEFDPDLPGCLPPWALTADWGSHSPR